MNSQVESMIGFCFCVLVMLFLFSAVASYFDLAPPLMLDIGNWASENTLTLAFTFCFFIGAVVILALKRRHVV